VNKVILDWLRPLWEGDQEVVKRSGRDEPMWVAIHQCMETTLGISLYIYFYLKPAKMLCISYHLSCFLSNKIKQECGTGSARKLGGGVEVAQIMYTHVSKCKNDKIKKIAVECLCDPKTLLGRCVCNSSNTFLGWGVAQ
jgi:hypothetical protein